MARRTLRQEDIDLIAAELYLRRSRVTAYTYTAGEEEQPARGVRQLSLIFDPEGNLADFADGWPKIPVFTLMAGDIALVIQVNDDEMDDLSAFPAMRERINRGRVRAEPYDRPPWQGSGGGNVDPFPTTGGASSSSGAPNTTPHQPTPADRSGE